MDMVSGGTGKEVDLEEIIVTAQEGIYNNSFDFSGVNTESIRENLQGGTMIPNGYSVRIEPPIADQASQEPRLFELDHEEACESLQDAFGFIPVIGTFIWRTVDQAFGC